MASNLRALIDDISTILDDVALLSKATVKKTAGVMSEMTWRLMRSISLGTVQLSLFVTRVSVLSGIAIAMRWARWCCWQLLWLNAFGRAFEVI